MNTPSVTNRTPKERFMQSGTRVSNHRNMASSDGFQESADCAMLEYTGRLASHSAPNEAGVMGLKLQGAHEFLQIFRNLGENQIAPTIALAPTLNHKA